MHQGCSGKPPSDSAGGISRICANNPGGSANVRSESDLAVRLMSLVVAQERRYTPGWCIFFVFSTWWCPLSYLWHAIFYVHLHATAQLAAEAGCTEQEVVQFQAKLKKAHSAFSGCETPPSHASAPQSKVGLSSPPVVSDASSDATPSNNGRDNDCFSFSTH